MEKRCRIYDAILSSQVAERLQLDEASTLTPARRSFFTAGRNAVKRVDHKHCKAWTTDDMIVPRTLERTQGVLLIIYLFIWPRQWFLLGEWQFRDGQKIHSSHCSEADVHKSPFIY